MNQRWCVYIDVLGFSNLWDLSYPTNNAPAQTALNELMKGIYQIGVKVYPHEPERLFVHQMGDGFAIFSSFGEGDLERPISIAVALMRHVASTGLFAAAAVAEGRLADITGCYPNEVMGNEEEGTIQLGDGRLYLSPVMGTAFIRAYRLQEQAHCPIILVSGEFAECVPDGFKVHCDTRNGQSVLSVDWLGAESQSLGRIQAKISLESPGIEDLTHAIHVYCREYPCGTKKWLPQLSKLLPAYFQAN